MSAKQVVPAVFCAFVGGLALGRAISSKKCEDEKVKESDSETDETDQNTEEKDAFERAFMQTAIDISRTKVRNLSTADFGEILNSSELVAPIRNKLNQDLKHDSVFRLVLTGGPCAGKSTVISTVTSYLTSKGFGVIHVQETSTTLRNSGILYSPSMADDFQMACIRIQSNREDVALDWAKKLAPRCQRNKVVIINDRGLVDGLCFVTAETMTRCLKLCDVDDDLYKRYDCVFHLVTAADGAPKFYQKTSYRHENIEEAISQDKKLKEVWGGHPNHHIFRNRGTFQEKVENVLQTLCDLLKIASLKRVPRRFVLKNSPRIPKEVAMVKEFYHKTYIHVAEDKQDEGHICTFLRYSKRLKRHSLAADKVFLEDPHAIKADRYVKKSTSKRNDQQITVKKRLRKDQYYDMLKTKDPNRMEVKQIRTFISLGQNKALLEVSEYQEPNNGLCLLNVYQPIGQVLDPDDLPPYINVQQEVTGQKKFSAHNISLRAKESSRG